ncbi:MAG: amidohydrolase family protein [Capsulimonadaceae bacterium]|nr:amidohydrolase family protein [Capsulimonadaceae bacterium]
MPLFDCHTYLTVASFSSSMRTREQVLESMERFGLDGVALISGLGASGDFSNGNRMLREVVDEEQGLLGYVTLNASYPEESLQEQRMYMSKHEFVGGVLIAEPGRPVTLKAARDIVNAQRRYGKPILLYTGDTAAVHAAQEIAEEFHLIKFIFLGMGGNDWRAAVETARKCLNVNLEISGCLDADKVTVAVNAISARRIVFGSGLPHGDPSLYRGLVQDCEILTTSDRNRITLDNALALFKINAEVEE